MAENLNNNGTNSSTNSNTNSAAVAENKLDYRRVILAKSRAVSRLRADVEREEWNRNHCRRAQVRIVERIGALIAERVMEDIVFFGNDDLVWDKPYEAWFKPGLNEQNDFQVKIWREFKHAFDEYKWDCYDGISEAVKQNHDRLLCLVSEKLATAFEGTAFKVEVTRFDDPLYGPEVRVKIAMARKIDA
ncbi:hypothetical protein IJJ27_04620 [bacterium]|nr:hypothetical protein [bacterium]